MGHKAVLISYGTIILENGEAKPIHYIFEAEFGLPVMVTSFNSMYECAENNDHIKNWRKRTDLLLHCAKLGKR